MTVEDQPRAAPLPVSADVGIVAAMPIEVGFLTDRLEGVRRYEGASSTVIEGEHGGKLVAVIVGGPGRDAARAATNLLLDGHKPRWIVSAGFAGALDPELRRNDILLPNAILGPYGLRFQIDLKLEFPEDAPGRRILSGTLATVDALVRSARDKAALRERLHAEIVDMETSSVAEVCADRAVRFLSIRVVSDDASTELPAEFDQLMHQKGARQAGSALRAIWNRPSSLKDFWRLHSQGQEAADRLADVTLSAISRLPD